MDIHRIYPYIASGGAFDPDTTGLEGHILPLGHDVHALLVHDRGSTAARVQPAELAAAGLTPAQAHAAALENLVRLASSPAIDKKMYQGPRNLPYVIWTGHWLAAACARLPDLYAWGLKTLVADDLCVSIPQHELMLLFPKGDRDFRDQMRALIDAAVWDAHRPITFELFSLTANGLTPFDEPA